MKFWPFTKEPLALKAKPRIMNAGAGRMWLCGVDLTLRPSAPGSVTHSCEAPMGRGETADAAYADWASLVATREEWRSKYAC